METDCPDLDCADVPELEPLPVLAGVEAVVLLLSKETSHASR
jgi:hypothetical protein